MTTFRSLTFTVFFLFFASNMFSSTNLEIVLNGEISKKTKKVSFFQEASVDKKPSTREQKLTSSVQNWPDWLATAEYGAKNNTCIKKTSKAVIHHQFNKSLQPNGN